MSVGDPDPHVFGPPESGFISQRYGSGVGSGSISQMYEYGDPDPHQNVTDPQHCLKLLLKLILCYFSDL